MNLAWHKLLPLSLAPIMDMDTRTPILIPEANITITRTNILTKVVTTIIT